LQPLPQVVASPNQEIERLTKEIANLKIFIGNNLGQQRNTPPWRARNSSSATGANTTQVTCHRCDEEGHWASRCMVETPQKAQPRNNNQRGVNVVQIKEIFDTDEEEETVFPVEIKKKPGHPNKKTTPYDKKGKEKTTAGPSTPRNVTFEDETRRIIERELTNKQDEEMQETPEVNFDSQRFTTSMLGKNLRTCKHLLPLENWHSYPLPSNNN
jgi:hypothetical protein